MSAESVQPVLRKFWKRLLSLDESLSFRLGAITKSAVGYQSARVLAHLGDGWLWLAGSLILLLFGSQTTRQLVLLMAGSILIAVGMTSGLKFLVRRPRPRDRKGYYDQRLDRYAFPSGHSARVACISFWLSSALPLWSPLLIAYALLVPASRVALGLHHMTDVLVGLSLGLLVSSLVLAYSPF